MTPDELNQDLVDQLTTDLRIAYLADNYYHKYKLIPNTIGVTVHSTGARTIHATYINPENERIDVTMMINARCTRT